MDNDIPVSQKDPGNTTVVRKALILATGRGEVQTRLTGDVGFR